MVSWKKLEDKWIKRWADAKIFEAAPDKRKKYMVTFPYPYINLYPHIGHFYSLMRVETMARFKRMQGYNVLYSQGWHVTGSPIINAARRIKNGESKQVKILKDAGFSEKEIPKFEDPKHWIKTFSTGWKDDLTSLGISIDWRRNFHTTSLNPHYSKFVEWQFRKLKEKGYVKKGKKPVVWCDNCKMAIGDHSRTEGEGETPQEFTLLKFRFEDAFIMAATLRPETIYGQTNLWVDPDVEYVKTKVNNETWIISRECSEKLGYQDKKVEVVGTIKGEEMVGKYATAPGIDREIIILPSGFCSPKKGTGIVTSVPSDAPDDYMGLYDLWNSKELCEKHGLSWEQVKEIKVIPIIRTTDWGDQAAVKICTDWKIKNQMERDKLEKAKKEIYKAGFHTGIMNENCGKYKGMKVEDAKDKIKAKLLKEGKADVMYEPTGRVVCRCLNEAVIKVVSDQWFIAYGDEKWKKLAHKCLDKMELFPDKTRAQFNYVLDWLDDWACTHKSETDLGTPLPWDTKWVIESLSDSTIYMAYYTIAHKIKKIPAEKINDDFFDYVLLGKKTEPDLKIAKELHDEFNYWYPMDFRSTGKDLIQNHMSFCIFNHTAIFPEKHWPRSYGLNGWVTVDGNKMSKSLGNVISVREMVPKFGADSSRFTVLSGGEGIDDANWDSELAKSMKDKLAQMINFVKEYYNQGVYEEKTIDKWMRSQINLIIKETTELYEKTMYRSVLQKAYYDMQRIMKWYLRRTGNKPNKDVMNKAIETQILLLAPIIPFTAEECWELMGKQGFVSLAEWPGINDKEIDPDADVLEGIVETVVDDINSVLRLIKIKKPKTVKLIVSPGWKYDLYKQLEGNQERNFGKLMAAVMKHEQFKRYSKPVAGLLQKYIKGGLSVKASSQDLEYNAMMEARDFLAAQFSGAEIVVEKAEDSSEQKAGNAMPNKPAILVE